MKKTRGILSEVLIPLLSILNVSVAVATDLAIPAKWLPSNTQNGQIVTTAVRVFVNAKEPFKDPRSGKMTYQNKAVVLRQEGKETSDTSAWLYLNTTNSLPSNATLRVTGLLSISEQQIKGGEYPATINVQSWEEYAEFSTKETQPTATTTNSISFNEDEMEGLYTELAEGATDGWTWRVGSPSSLMPAGPPTVATGEEVDDWPSYVHNALRQHVRNDGKAMTANLRTQWGEPSEVWNHDVYKYESTMAEAGGGNEKIVRVTTIITSSSDTPSMPPDAGKREDTYVYLLEYQEDGTIDDNSENQNWESCTGFVWVSSEFRVGIESVVIS